MELTIESFLPKKKKTELLSSIDQNNMVEKQDLPTTLRLFRRLSTDRFNVSTSPSSALCLNEKLIK